MNIIDLIKNVDKFTREDMKLSNPFNEILYNIGIKEGIKLAKRLNANVEIVTVGISLMDCKLPIAQKMGVVEKHIEMAVEKTNEILEDYNLDIETKNNIINCIEAHHGTKPYLNIEAEICANADCYRFISPIGFFTYCSSLGSKIDDLQKVLEQLNFKLDEKYNIITLPEVKEELEPYYIQFKNLITKAKEDLK